MAVSNVSAMAATLASTQTRGLLPCYVGDGAEPLERYGEPLASLRSELWLLIHADLRRSARVRALVELLLPQLTALRPTFEGSVPLGG